MNDVINEEWLIKAENGYISYSIFNHGIEALITLISSDVEGDCIVAIYDNLANVLVF